MPRRHDNLTARPPTRPTLRIRWLRIAVATALAAVVLTPFGAAPAAAGESTATATVPFQDTDFAQPVPVAQFDPAQGILSQVEITATLTIRGGIQVENTSPNPVAVNLNLVSTSALTGPSFGPVLAEARSEGVTADLGVYDGTADFAGPSATVFPGLTGTGSTTVLLDAADVDLSPYIGTGTVEFPVNTTSSFDGSGPGGNTLVEFENQAQVEIAVRYLFDGADITIEKATNGEDADEAPGPSIIIGQPVTWTYVVTNTGDVALNDVTVVDDQGVAVSCPQTTLQPDETMTCTATGTAVGGQYRNVGTTTGTPDPPLTPVTDDDPSHHTGVPEPPPDTLPQEVTPPPQLPQTGPTSVPLAVVGTLLGLLGAWGLWASRRFLGVLLTDRDLDALARTLPTWKRR